MKETAYADVVKDAADVADLLAAQPENPEAEHARKLVVRGSDSQLARAADNLIRNAVDAVAGSGRLVVKSARVDIVEPRAGYEIVPPGQYARTYGLGRVGVTRVA